MEQRTNIQRGMAVMSSDGVQVGRVIDVAMDGLIIEKGQFFLRDFRVPFEDISMCRGEEIILKRDHAALRRSDMDSAKFQDHDQYDLRPSSEAIPPPIPPSHEPSMAERRAAGPGWDPLSVDEEQEQAPRIITPAPKTPTRY